MTGVPAAEPALRWGVTLPLAGLPLRAHRPVFEGLAAAGYTDVWTAEGGGVDAFTPLAVGAAWAPSLRLASAIVPVFTRGPAVLAQTAATLAGLTSGGLVLGIGSSVPAHVSDINGIPFGEPFKRTRDTLRFLTRALRGETVAGDFDTFSIRGFALHEPPAVTPKVILGALRPTMLRLGFAEGDGAVTNLLFARDVPRVVEAAGPRRPDQELVVKVFVSPTADAERARASARPFLGWILNQEPYHAFHEWLGNGESLAESRARWLAGDRFGASAALPDEVVDGLFVHGTPEQCREQIARYAQPGVSAVQLFVQAPPSWLRDPARALDLLRQLRPAAPRASAESAPSVAVTSSPARPS